MVPAPFLFGDPMPYKSAAQARLFHYLESKGEMPKKTVAKYDRMTEFEDLPERVKAAMGGIMGEIAEMDLDETLDTSGEPEKEDKLQGYGFAEHLKRKMRGL